MRCVVARSERARLPEHRGEPRKRQHASEHAESGARAHGRREERRRHCQPEQRPPDPINISVRNAEDVMNPIFLALLAKTGQAPSPADLAAAQQMIAVALGHAPMLAAAPQPPAVGDPNFGPLERITKRVDEPGA